MATPKTPYNDLPNDKKIEAKLKQIKKLFKNLPKERQQFAKVLMYQFAVTTVTLERLVDEINNGDVIEIFVQGTQKLRRENPALRSYNATVKSFTSLSKGLIDLLPDTTQKQAGEELMSFVTKPSGVSKK